MDGWMDGAISLFLVPRKATEAKRKEGRRGRRREKEEEMQFGLAAGGRHIRLCRLIALFAFEELSPSTATATDGGAAVNPFRPPAPAAQTSFQRQVAECLMLMHCRAAGFDKFASSWSKYVVSPHLSKYTGGKCQRKRHEKQIALRSFPRGSRYCFPTFRRTFTRVVRRQIRETEIARRTRGGYDATQGSSK